MFGIPVGDNLWLGGSDASSKRAAGAAVDQIFGVHHLRMKLGIRSVVSRVFHCNFGAIDWAIRSVLPLHDDFFERPAVLLQVRVPRLAFVGGHHQRVRGVAVAVKAPPLDADAPLLFAGGVVEEGELWQQRRGSGSEVKEGVCPVHHLLQVRTGRLAVAPEE